MNLEPEESLEAPRVLQRPVRPVATIVLVVGSILGTLGLGVLLRWFLAGVPVLPGDFGDLRHAHSHLGYYGILFPLMWWAWARSGARAPSAPLVAFYAIAVGISTIGFLREGYGRPAIVGSTAVLAIWLVSAWGLRRHLGRLQDWLGGVGPAILLGALCIPPVAVISGRDPALGAGLVRTFLSLVLLGAVLPSALRMLRTPAPPWPLWLLFSVAGSIYLGALPHPALGLGLVGLAVLLGRSVLRAGALPLDERTLWMGLAFGLATPGLGLLAPSHSMAVSGVHFIVLGPLLLVLSRPLWPRPLPLWARLPYAGAVGLMSTAILVPMPRIAAVAGSVIALSWVAGLVWALASRALGHLAHRSVGNRTCSRSHNAEERAGVAIR